MCIYTHNIYIEKLPHYPNNNGKIIWRFLQFFFGNFCHWFSNNRNNTVKFQLLAFALFLKAVKSTRNILTCQYPHQHVNLIWPQVILASSLLLLSVMALQEMASDRHLQETHHLPYSGTHE